MKSLIVPCTDGDHVETVYQINELSFMDKLMQCAESRKRGITYLEISCAFDIETTNIEADQLERIYDIKEQYRPRLNSKFRPFAFMYHWQFCFDNEVVFGRTWEEFTTLLSTLEKNLNLSDTNRLVIWCHNLPFEFQFFRWFVKVTDSFCREKYSPLKIVTDYGIEFRDSLALSNMSLEKFCENENAIHAKLSGEDFDYRRIRTPITVMSNKELAYCYNDVRGLCECITSRMRFHTLAQMPMTSTGYVRNDIKKALRTNKANRERFKQCALDKPQYEALRLAFRGGETHANPAWSNQILKNLRSYDKQSSYPAQMLCEKFPASAWLKIKKSTYLNHDLTGQGVLLHVYMKEVRFIGNHGMPYLARSKMEYCATCKDLSLPILDNGRIIYSQGVIFWCTEIDLEIIKQDYSYEDIDFKEIYVCNMDYLSKEYRGVILDYFYTKSKLKGIESKLYEYNRSKNSLNGIYGDTVMRIDQPDVRYINGEYVETLNDLEAILEKYYKSRSSYRIYQVGVYVTAYARKALFDAIRLTGRDTVYIDTDSNKHLGDHEADFQRLNDELLKKAYEHDAYCEFNGKLFALGLWEREPDIAEFKTLGSKKYVYREHGSDQVKCVIAGVNKKRGSRFFTEHGIEAFKNGTVIHDSGHLVAYRNDDEIHQITIDHCTFTTASNIALIDDTYTIGNSSDIDSIFRALELNAQSFYFA